MRFIDIKSSCSCCRFIKCKIVKLMSFPHSLENLGLAGVTKRRALYPLVSRFALGEEKGRDKSKNTFVFFHDST